MRDAFRARGHEAVSCDLLPTESPGPHTDIVPGRHAKVHREPPGPDRWKNRSRTYPGIAAAMAEQWGDA